MSAVLKVAGVSKRFGGVQALNGVSFELNHGEILGLIGPNGAGKTTLFHVIAGTILPDAGSIIFEGCDITRMKAHQICRLGVARTFQVTRPFAKLTCRENVLVAFVGSQAPVAKVERDERAAEYLALVGLGGKDLTPAGQLNLIDKKRLEMARALATNPRLILLDEVLGGLNSLEMGQAMELIGQIREKLGTTIIWIEHVMGAIMRLSERVLVLDQGSLICQGTPAQVSQDRSVIEAYLGEQDA
ncbi:MAG: ABC transporter ATP-binding protein [Pseudomonadota bacterium]